MSASDRIRDAIYAKKAEVDKYGWKSSSPEWQRAFGYMAGLHVALDLMIEAKDPAPVTNGNRGGENG